MTDLETYGLMGHLGAETERSEVLEMFKWIYSMGLGSGPTMDLMSQTGLRCVARDLTC